MSDQAQQRAEAGAANAPLSRRQKIELALLARRAWEKLHPPSRPQTGAMEGDPPAAVGSEGFDTWRHQQVLLTVERKGLRECTNEDFNPLRAHFLGLLGQDRAAVFARARAGTDDRRRALAKLAHELHEAQDVIDWPRDYIAAIAHSRYRTRDIDRDLSARQIWGLVFDIRRAAQRRRGKRGKAETRKAEMREAPPF